MKLEARGKEITQPMRIFRTFYLVVLFSLSLGVFCGEIPEDLRLKDDTTNDYVNDSCTRAAREIEVECKTSIPDQHITVIQSHVKWRHAADLVEPSPAAGKELLPLLSIRRT
jgi:hypothetical protein